MVSQGALVVMRDGKGVRGAEGLQRYRGVAAWKEWAQVNRPFGQEVAEEYALRGKKCRNDFGVYYSIQGYTVLQLSQY